MPKRIVDLVFTTVVLGACIVSCKGAGAGAVTAGNGGGGAPAVASAPPPGDPVATPASDTSGGQLPGQGHTCEDGKCAGNLECVVYYGFAGPAGPKFTSCEVKCQPSKALCPDGQKCVTIADGPGSVCRPAGG